MEFRCYYCQTPINRENYLEIMFKGEIIGYICKQCPEN